MYLLTRNNIIQSECASLARVSRAVIHFIFALEPSAIDMEKVTSDNLDLRTYVITRNIFVV